APRTTQRLHGYYAWWTRGLWLNLDLSVYDKIFFFSVTPAADGSLAERHGWPFAWEGLRARADSAAVPVIPVLALLDEAVLAPLFTDSTHRSNLVESSMELIEESGDAGLHLDFEWFSPAPDSVREGFHAFLDSLTSRVERERPEAALSIFVPGLQMSGMIDVSRIPDIFQEIMVQGYDIHWQTGPTAGPLAPLEGWAGADWEGIADSMAVRGIAAERIVMTVPYYGYEWPAENDRPGSGTRGMARTVTYARVDSLNLPEMQVAAQDRVEAHGLMRDPRSGSPYYAFADSTGWVQGWFEDRESLAAKYRWVRERSMRGVAIFPIGYDASRMDDLLLETFGTRRQDQ
ncbi:MAG: glycosyl hydrolase family 18 protein, partial [Bacteroidetes bacterium]|nr:glycosyl hydrolase family 18 protein [Bacteroidota bacterium]